MDKSIDIELGKVLWADFIYEGRLDPRIRPEIADSWKKCRQAGVNPAGGEGRYVDAAVFQSIYSANRILIDTALPIMRSVFQIVQDTSYLMVLTDSVGYILETMGDEEILIKSENLRFGKGHLWNSLEVGTNAISVALEYDRAIQMVGAEHYCRSHHTWTCSAAPIHGIEGEIIGCINFSGTIESAHEHTLALALAAAYGIESQIKIKHNAQLLNTALDASNDAIFLVNGAYRTLWMNAAARKLAGPEADKMSENDFRDILPDVNWPDRRDYFSDDTRFALGDKLIYCGVDVHYLDSFGTPAYSIALKKQKHLLNAVNRLSRNKARYKFEDFLTNDGTTQKMLTLAKRYAEYEGNILIEGESGTGKEMIAQAIHNAGSHRDGPFVTINCASIPREMMESELFGCEVGAFGGKITESSPGRFELAQNGTAFLNEISEMPLELQAKILHTVETHTVRRLGSTRDIRLNIRIISASGRPVAPLVSSGSFRRDLYHRLDVLRLDIRPLRERQCDIILCAQKMLDQLNFRYPELKKTATPEFMTGLLNCDWPGNVRQLQNSIERVFYSETGGTLTEESLKYVYGELTEEMPERLCAESNQVSEIADALENCGGDVGAAAAVLGISRATLYRRLKKYNIDPKRSRK